MQSNPQKTLVIDIKQKPRVRTCTWIFDQTVSWRYEFVFLKKTRLCHSGGSNMGALCVVLLLLT